MTKSSIINNLIKQTKEKSIQDVDLQIQDIIYKINNNSSVESFSFTKNLIVSLN